MVRFLAFLIVLAAIAVGAGYYLNWFNVNVNEDKIQHDTAAAQEKVNELSTKAKEYIHRDKDNAAPGEPQTARGQVKALDLGDNRFVLQTDGSKDVTFYTEPATEVMRDDQRGRPGDLKVGDKAVVVYQVKDGKKVAESITANK
jgi:hypothetical protein